VDRVPQVDKPIHVGLVQINNSFSNQNYLPLSIGMMQAYTMKHLSKLERYRFGLPIYARIAVEAAVERLSESDIVLFSTYVWNFRISLEIARRLKAIRPEVVIAFGGPQVPARADHFLREYPFVDVASHGEGEIVGHALLENFPTRKWNAVPSVSFIDGEGQVVRTPKAARVAALGQLPSPYLEGTFDQLINAFPAEQWIGLWETDRGCPFSCTFCDWGSAVQAKVYQFDMERLCREIDWFADREIEFVFCCDANFGILPRDLEIASYVADVKRRRGYPHALSVQSTKNATERAYKVQKILSDAGLNKGVAVALQSINPMTLVNIKRSNISTESYQELQRRFTRDQVDTYTDLILGLPGDTYASFVDSVATIIDNGQHNRIQFNNLSILPNAEMGDPEYQRRFGMKTVESDIINIHGALNAAEATVVEKQQLVIATETMPHQDWVKVRAFSWFGGLLHFDKVLQIPLVLAHECGGLGYGDLLEAFSGFPLPAYPILDNLRTFFNETAGSIQRGGPEYCWSEQWLNIWWPADEFALIKLCTEDKLEDFYGESERRLEALLSEQGRTLPSGLLRDATAVNRALFKLPFATTDVEVATSYNIVEYYQGVLRGDRVDLEQGPHLYHINRTNETWSTWESWCREVIWYGNKRGAYLYGSQSAASQLAGHF